MPITNLSRLAMFLFFLFAVPLKVHCDYFEQTFIDATKRSSSIVLAKLDKSSSDESTTVFEVEKVLFGETDATTKIAIAENSQQYAGNKKFLLALDKGDLVDLSGTTETSRSIITVENGNVSLKFLNGTKGNIALEYAWYTFIAPILFDKVIRSFYLNTPFDSKSFKNKCQYLNYHLMVKDNVVEIVNFDQSTKTYFHINKGNIVRMEIENIKTTKSIIIHDSKKLGVNYSGYAFFLYKLTPLENRRVDLGILNEGEIDYESLSQDQKKKIEIR